MSHIQEIENLFDEKFYDINDFDAKKYKSFLLSSHLKYLKSKKKELEGEKRMLTGLNATQLERDNYFYNLAKQEEIDKIDKEIYEYNI